MWLEKLSLVVNSLLRPKELEAYNEDVAAAAAVVDADEAASSNSLLMSTFLSD